jgi:hypothetical protein
MEPEQRLADSHDICERIDRKFDKLEATLRKYMIAQTFAIGVIMFALLHCMK